ncbi:hypothetical protein Y1Q_0015002 [Alligator mississippiensis]|uniref:Uncharacterized protein n=1 Tax=Alligator mississippiensis TaxID=8496 RepID=A0A151N8T0_ALLMI|nr:hypothetical protein Y1Q_0015002 [Alligator mississippiensis]
MKLPAAPKGLPGPIPPLEQQALPLPHCSPSAWTASPSVDRAGAAPSPGRGAESPVSCPLDSPYLEWTAAGPFSFLHSDMANLSSFLGYFLTAGRLLSVLHQSLLPPDRADLPVNALQSSVLGSCGSRHAKLVLKRTALFPSGARALHFTVTKTLALCSSKLVFKGNLDRELCSANVESPGQRGAMAELRVGPFLTDERLSPWSRQQQKWV